MIIIGIVILSLVVLTSAGLFSVVFTPTDFELSVTSYVPRGGSGTNNKLIGTFDESAEFDLTIVNSVHPEDFIIKIVDESGDSKIIFSQEYSPSCDMVQHQLINHQYSNHFKIIYDDYSIKLLDGNGNRINYVTKTADFGEAPYNINFIVTRARGSACNNDGIAYKDGQIEVNNILLTNFECLSDEDCSSGISFFVMDELSEDINCENNICVVQESEEVPEEEIIIDEPEEQEESKFLSGLLKFGVGIILAGLFVGSILFFVLRRKKK